MTYKDAVRLQDELQDEATIDIEYYSSQRIKNPEVEIEYPDYCNYVVRRQNWPEESYVDVFKDKVYYIYKEDKLELDPSVLLEEDWIVDSIEDEEYKE